MSSIQFSSHPFRFLLYLEWIILFLAAIAEALPAPYQRVPSFPLLTIFSITAFGVMGLKLPVGNQKYKVLYIALQFFLIFLTALARSRTMRIFPFLYLILVIRSCLLFKFPGRLVVTTLCFGLFLLSLILRFNRFSASPAIAERLRFVLVGYGLLFGLSLVFVLLLMNAAIAERQSREQRDVALLQLRQYALRIEDQATLQERNRIAREIHDSLGHSLTALNLQLETALKLGQSQQDLAQSFIIQAKQLASQALREVRQSVSTMRSDALLGQSLPDAIATLTTQFQGATGVLPICTINLSRPLPNEINTAVYRILQESLTNVSKYGSATEVKIELTAKTNELYLAIQDNGRGFNLNQNTTGFGLHSMRDRTTALGGTFNIDSYPQSGCLVTVKIPLPILHL
ncbi:sensor histidine kinase [Aliterella atlantica]|uniref:histidine kinase n=1 Tax=Aliterella atlantica CENA595 TaxID=1618023 RepID=A0A0D8ZSB8_9CYAN|nr:sensor histidine kinase [Aliterella atlantica]KJH70121.1 ATPase [Aliterella atlantica CENA595]